MAVPFPAAHIRQASDRDFKLSLQSDPPDTHVSVQGDLDLATAPLVSERLRAEIDAGCRRMMIDLSQVTFIDASAPRDAQSHP
jgi:anti-anti-sigma factor